MLMTERDDAKARGGRMKNPARIKKVFNLLSPHATLNAGLVCMYVCIGSFIYEARQDYCRRTYAGV